MLLVWLDERRLKAGQPANPAQRRPIAFTDICLHPPLRKEARGRPLPVRICPAIPPPAAAPSCAAAGTNGTIRSAVERKPSARASRSSPQAWRADATYSSTVGADGEAKVLRRFAAVAQTAAVVPPYLKVTFYVVFYAAN